MNRVIAVVCICFVPSFLFAQQAGKCPFPVPAGKVKNDQYSRSSADAIKKSKKEMADQQDVFDKKKYQSVVRGKSAPKKAVQKPRYY